MKRRGFLIGGFATLFAAPAIVRAASLMTVKRIPGAVDDEFTTGRLLLRSYERYSISYMDWRGTFGTFPTQYAAFPHEVAA